MLQFWFCFCLFFPRVPPEDLVLHLAHTEELIQYLYMCGGCWYGGCGCTCSQTYGRFLFKLILILYSNQKAREQ